MKDTAVRRIQDLKEEHVLIQKAMEGDKESLESLLLSCQGKAYSIAFRYMKNEEDAMDVLQESFIKIFRSITAFNFESRFDTWVYRIVMNTCNDFYRKNKKHANLIYFSGYGEEENEAPLEIPDEKAGPGDILEKKEEGQLILKCVDLLSEEHRQVILLRDIKGFSYEEISEILNCSIGTVKSRISRARLRLREIYLSETKEDHKD